MAEHNLTAVGFEPTQLALVELESTPLDHSGKVSCYLPGDMKQGQRVADRRPPSSDRAHSCHIPGQPGALYGAVRCCETLASLWTLHLLASAVVVGVLATSRRNKSWQHPEVFPGGPPPQY